MNKEKYIVLCHEVNDKGDISMWAIGPYETRKDAFNALGSSVNEAVEVARNNNDEITIDFGANPVVSVRYCGSVTNYKLEVLDA